MNTGSGKDDDRNTAEAPSVATSGRRIALLDNRIESSELFASTREIIIAHGADVYRLRLTAQNKLILTK